MNALRLFYALLGIGIMLLLSINLTFAQVQLSMALTDEDEEINFDPEILCTEPVVGCLNIGVSQLITIKVNNPQQESITLDVSLRDIKLDPIWVAQPADVVDKGWASNEQTFEILVDLAGITKSQRAWLRAKVRFLGSGGVGGPGNVVSQPSQQQTSQSNDDIDDITTNNDKPNVQFWPVCLRAYSRSNAGDCSSSACPCEKDKWSPGFFAGFSVVNLPEPRTPTDFAFDTQNKFVGMTLSSPGRRIYYQFEAEVSTLNFTEILSDTGIASTGRSDTLNHSLMYVRVTPLQLRARIGRIASLGIGGSIKYMATADQGERRVVGPDEILVQNYHRWEPQAFVDLRIITSQRGLNLGARLERNFGQINQLERTPYSQGKVYIHFGF